MTADAATQGRGDSGGRTDLPGPDSIPGIVGRTLGFLAGLGMVWASILSIDHFFQANYPTSLYDGGFCDINAFFNCDSSTYSALAQFGGVPMGYFGAFMGLVVMTWALIADGDRARTVRFLHLANAVGVVALFLISVLVLGSLCLICTIYYVFALLGLAIAWWSRDGRSLGRFLRPSLRHLLVLAGLAGVGAYGIRAYHEVRIQAQSGGVAAEVVQEFFALEPVGEPSFISPFWTARATEEFSDAPVRIVEYADLLCSDCRYLAEQMDRLKADFPGQLNVAFQFFPLEAECNSVVEKDLHPGACELSYMVAKDRSLFPELHDEIFGDFQAAKTPEWRAEFAECHGLAGAPEDPDIRELVHRIIETGREFDRTSDKFSHGIRSTPTMIINGRMVIGTLPYEQLRAIVKALIMRSEKDGEFMENWVGS